MTRNLLVAVDHIMTSGLRVVCVILLAEMLSFPQLGSVGYPLAWQKKWAVIGGLETFFACTSPTALPASSAPGCALRQHNFAPWQDVLAPKPLGAVSGTRKGDLIKKLKCACGVGPAHASTCDCLPLWPCSLSALRYCLDEVTLLLYLCDFLHKMVRIASHVH